MSSLTLNIKHLRVFLEVVNSKSISKASSKVFLSQPAITQAIIKLENSLQTTLFSRQSGGMSVTESGTIFARRVTLALEELQNGIIGAIKSGGSNVRRSSSLLTLVTTTQLKALISVCEHPNFSAASREVKISQSSLHRSIRELESLLGIILFEKSSIGIHAIKAADILYKSAKIAFADINQGMDEINVYHRREVGNIAIGSMPFARNSILANTIINFSQTYPDFNVSINDGSYNDLLNHLLHGDNDILIGALRYPVPTEEVIQETLFYSSLVIAVRLDHPLCHTKKLTPKKLSNYSWIVPKRGTPTRDIFDSIFSKNECIPPKNILESGSQMLIRSLLLGSDRITIISKEQIQHELLQGDLVILPFNFKNSSRPIGITTRKSWLPTKLQYSFILSIRENISKIHI